MRNVVSRRSSQPPRRKPNLATVEETAKKYPFLTPASIRDRIYHATPRLSARGETIPPNGFGRCVIRIGQGKQARIFIDLDQFEEWLEGYRLAPLPATAPSAGDRS